WPRHGESVRREGQLAHERDVVAIPVIVIARHVAGVAAVDPSGRVREAVPDALPTAVGGHGPFHLVRRGGGAPFEPRRKLTAWHQALLRYGSALIELAEI